jgi:hypothetical protein
MTPIVARLSYVPDGVVQGLNCVILTALYLTVIRTACNLGLYGVVLLDFPRQDDSASL